MAQRKGLHAVLELPFFYNLVQAVFHHEKTKLEWERAIGDFAGKNILDIGCGPGKDAPMFIGANYYGLDISPIYIQEAKEKYGKFGTFICSSVDDLLTIELPKFDVIIMKGVLHHLSDEQINKMLETIKALLNQKGKLITLDPTLTTKQNPISRFLVKSDRGMNIRSDSEYKSILINNFSHIQSNVIHQSLPPYDRCLIIAEK